MSEGVRPWERQQGESPEAYTRFCCYLSLGPARSVDGAYQAYAASSAEGDGAATKKRAPGSWHREAREWRWADRATGHDVETLLARCRQTVALHVAVITELARSLIEGIRSRQGQWSDEAILEGIDVLGRLIPQETVTALAREAEQRRAPAMPAALPVQSQR